MKAKPTLTAFAGQDETIAALSRQISELRGQEHALIGQQIAAERDPGQSARLAEVQTKRAELTAAILGLEREWQVAVTMRAVREADRRGAEWRQLIHQTAMAIVRLQGLNRLRVATARQIRGKSIGPSLVCEINGALLLGDGVIGGPADIFLRDVIAAGIVTEGEVARARAEIERGMK